MRAPGCRLCPKLQDEVDCALIDGCDRDPHKANNWCLDDCYLDKLDGFCKEKSNLFYNSINLLLLIIYLVPFDSGSRANFVIK